MIQQTGTFVDPIVIAFEGLSLVTDTMVAFSLMRNMNHELEISSEPKKGGKITVRIPQKRTASEYSGSGSTTPSAVSVGSVEVSLDSWLYDQPQLNSADLFSLERMSQFVLEPSMNGFAEKVNTWCCEIALKIPYWAGSTSTFPTTLAHLIAPTTVLDKNRAPAKGRYSVLSAAAYGAVMAIPEVHKANERGQAGGYALDHNVVGSILGVEWYWDSAVVRHVSGTMSAENPAVDGIVAAGATVMNITDAGAGTQTIASGDLFSVDGYPDYQGVFLEDATAVAGDIAGISFYPAAPTGGFADTSAITILGDHTKNLLFAPEAVSAVLVPPPVGFDPSRSASIYDQETGVGLKVTYDRAATNLADILSLETFFGSKVLRPENFSIFVTPY